MNKYVPNIPAEFVVPLNMNKLRGRMLRLPPKKNKKREILVIYGHHASLERYYGFAELLNNYGGVTMPDLPGFGGMQSFYKIGERPDLDTLADYLATFVRWRYKNRSVSIVGISFGFLVVTRMLQKYPDIVKKVDLLVSGAGFAHKDDLAFSRNRHIFYRSIYTAFLPGPTAFIFRYGIINSLFLRTFYGRTHNAKNKFDGLNEEQKDAMTQFEIRLWHENDVRTWLRTCKEMLTLDNCRSQVDLPLWHIQVEADKYFNNDLVKQHLHIIFSDVFIVKAKLTKHSTDIIANAAAWNSMLPPKLKRELRKNP